MEYVIHTWKEYSRDYLEGIDWDQLKEFINYLRELPRNLLTDDIVEEDLPRIDDEKFNPGGWVGVYNLGKDTVKVMPDPERLPEDEFNVIKRELVGWLEALGPASMELFRKYMNTSIFERRLYTTFSRHLIKYTEIALSHFIPRRVLVESYIGRELRGRPVWDSIVSLRAKGLQLLMSRRISFDIRSPLNLLLTRFHAELLMRINKLLKTLSTGGTPRLLKDLDRYRRYHEEFINEGIFSELLREALEINFENPETLRRVRRNARGIFSEILDLWEAYLGEKAFLTDFEKIFDIALGPLSKIYELWCYKKLCEILGISEDDIRESPHHVSFGRGMLHYNPPGGLSRYSVILKEHIGVSPGRPDFAIEFNNKITCVMDAKCKVRLDTGDVQRLLSYLLDYMYPKQDRLVAIVFYLAREPENDVRKVRVRNCEIYLVSLTPEKYPGVKEEIRSIIESTLN